MRLTKNGKIIGKCSICNAPVSETQNLDGSTTASCTKCGAQRDDDLPVIKMVPIDRFPYSPWVKVSDWPEQMSGSSRTEAYYNK